MQKKTGISLIVLVITIIVMIILAAAIIISLNNTGIISNANTAKTKTDDKQIREAIEVAKLNLNFEGGINESNLQNELQKSLGVDVEVINNMDKSYTIKVKDMYYTLEEDETVVSGMYDKWDKTSTEPTQTTNEIHIYKASELKWLEEQVASGRDFKGYTVYLENNLDFGARENEGTTLDERWKTDTNKEYKWLPIGKTLEKPIKAEFDGKEHIIKGIYVEETTMIGGIFGVSHAPIKNLTVKNSYLEGQSYIAGIAGVGLEGCVISNCHNVNTTCVSSSGKGNRVAGIVAQAGDSVINCTNRGNIIAYATYDEEFFSAIVGGIAGSNMGRNAPNIKIENCINYGKIESYGVGVGGIMGYAVDGVKISNCINYGTVECNKKAVGGRSMCGGIAGTMLNSATISKCVNYGTVYAVGSQVGGITGLFSIDSTYDAANDKSLIDKCFNEGQIKGDSAVGGICGTMVDATESITYCYNKGKVIGNGSIGSIIGVYNNGGVIKHLYYLNTLNLKAVNNTDYVDKNVTSTTKNLKSFEEFETWISQFE